MQNETQRLEFINYIEKASIVLLGILFVFFPLVFTNLTTDVFVLPKQLLLIFVVLALTVLFGVKTYLAQNLSIKKTPFDVPILLFILSVFLSAFFSVARYDSFYNFIPFLLAGLAFFAISYNVKDKKELNILSGALLLGGALSGLFAILNFFKIYLIPLSFTHTQTFTTLGSSLDQAIYFGLLLPLGAYFLYPYVKKHQENIFSKSSETVLQVAFFGLTTLIILVGFIVSIYILLTLAPSVILPVATGFQVAFAAISQDAPRIIQGFLFGTGFGEFSIAFLRFKQAAFNLNQNLWSLTFFRSSSFVLELLATTGIAGLLSFLLIVYRAIKERPPFLPLIIVLLISFILPFGYYQIALLFFILGLYVSFKRLSNNKGYFDVELSLVASKKGFLTLSSEEISVSQQEKYGRVLGGFVLAIVVVFTLVVGFLTYNYAYSNVTFQKSLVAASNNNGSQTYTLQSNTLNSFSGKYVDAYYRVFSQTNLALANSLASSIPKGSSPSAQQSQTINNLIQQSITAARNATNVSANNAINWQNLSSIYRSLIGFGQNADSFAILAAQQSVQLDPTNPQEYIALGGIYYQLKQWDSAITQFQQAINLKPDLANAYYNYAHALMQKGDLNNALTALQTVKSLVAGNKQNTKQINDEIKALQGQIAQGQTQPANSNLNVNAPEKTLPAQNPPVKIPAPQITITPTTTPTPTVAPTTEGGLPLPSSTPTAKP